MAASGIFKSLKTQKISPLESGIETVFLTLVRQKQLFNAIDCITNCVNRVPSEEVLSSVIFEILMDDDCDKKTAIEANHYLNNVLTIFSPSDSSRRLFYRSALSGRREFGFTSLWSVFSHVINSCCIHYKICGIEELEKNPILYPNCDILVDFYVRAMIDNYEYLSVERVFHEGTERSLVMDLFWPSTELSNLTAAKYPSLFLQWLNKIYFHSARVSKVNAIKSLHKLLNLMIQCILHFENSQCKTSTSTIIPDSLICNSLCVLDIVKVIFNNCKEIFNSLENFRRFLHHLSSKALQFKVCEYKLYEILNSKQPSERKFSSCTLHTIVTVYMLPKKLAVGSRGRPKKQPQNDLQVEDEYGKNEKISSNMNSKSLDSRESALHEFCRAKKPADLYQILTSDATLDVNEKNNLGQTPLHIACLSQSYLCAKILIEECSSEESRHKLNFSAADEEGQTSLHIAIKKEATGIVRSILKCGGSKLIEVKDKYGRKPSHYASKEMKQILKEFSINAESSKSAVSLNTITDLDVPTFQNFKEYAFYCHVLHFMVTYYAHIYNLFHVKRLINGNSSLVEVLKHQSKSCPHFKSCGENAVCSEDLDYIKILPDIIVHFVKRMSENAKGKGLNLDLELFPPQVFAAVLD